MLLKKPGPVEENPLSGFEMDAPEIGDEEILVRVKVCGLCHTDLHTIEGEIIPPVYPVVPGHQIVGRIVKLGSKVNKFKPEDRVGIGWLNKTCGKCEYCRKGMENLCENASFTGFHTSGGYGELVKVHQDYAFNLPEKLDDEHTAPLLCGGIIGYRSLRLSGVFGGETLGLFGFGTSAHIVIQVAVSMGVRVFVFTRSKEHRKLAENLGAEWVGGADDRPPRKIDAGITFAPAGPVVISALNHLKPAGTLAINAIFMTEIPSIKYEQIYREKKITTVTNYTRDDVIEFLSAVEKIDIKTEVKTFPLRDANEALNLLKQSKINGAGVLLIE